MSVVLLDPRFPAMLPVEAVPLLGGDVAYTEEVPVRVRWVIADLGGHTVDESDVLVTTDPDNSAVLARLKRGDDLVRSPSLLVEFSPDRELEAPGATASLPGVRDSPGQVQAESGPEYTVSGGGYVDGEVVGSDEHTVAVAGMRRTTRTEVPGSVMDEIEDAVALMTRALRQGEWEQSQTHHSLLAYLREETEELAEVVESADASHEEDIDQQELCTELSDILLQVLFHAEIANRRGSFDIGHVAGAFVAKMRNRAPYLFEEAERPVSAEEQDRLWAEGRAREGKEPYKEAPGAHGRASSSGQVDSADSGVSADSALSVDSADSGVEGEQVETAAPDPGQGPGRLSDGEGGDGVTDSQAGDEAYPVAETFPAVAPAPAGVRAAASPLAAAEEIISVARAAGLKDVEIPTSIRYPMVGLESDAPGDAENRLMAEVNAFRRVLGQRLSAPGRPADVEAGER